MPRDFVAPAECPVCGESVPRGARACPACGADERSGWNEDATLYDDLDLPASAFASAEPPAKPSSWRNRLWLAVAILALAVLVVTFVLR